MEFGIQFFPDVGPLQQSAADYFRASLDLAAAAEPLGYTHVRTVEHYFEPYGGYSPNPIVFLSAASQRTKKMRLITGAILPVFNNPLKLAGEIGMLDGISGGRLDVGIARAFLPHEFRRFGVSPDESAARYREGVEQIDLLLREENVTHHGQFHNIESVTSLPRPTQKPRPRFFVACNQTPETFEYAGRNGHSIMCVPMASEKLRELLSLYRSAYRSAGHPGAGEVMLAFHMFVDQDGERARALARPQIEAYFEALLRVMGEWDGAVSSKDYKGYDRSVRQMREMTLDTLIASGSAWVGTPGEVCATIARLQQETGGFEHASLQASFHLLPHAEALRSLALFAREVIPLFRQKPVLANG